MSASNPPPAAAPTLYTIGGPPSLPTSAASLRLPAEHFAASAAFLLLGAIALVIVAPDLAAGLYQSPRVIAATHLFTLGWLTTTIFGAFYQLLPVALGAPIRSTRLGHAAYCAYVPGVALFVSGVALVRPALIHAALVLVSVGVLCVVVNIGLTLPRATRRDVTWRAIALALSCLVLTLLLGATLAVNLTSGMLAGLRVHVTAVHLHIALIGWVLVTIVGISHRLLPMFLLAHGADARWTGRSLAALITGLALLVIGFAAGSRVILWLAVASIELGIGCFIAQAYSFARARKRPRLDAGLEHAGVGLLFLVLAALLGPAVLAFGRDHARLAVAYVMLGLVGGLSLYVVGQFYKIVPFLAWIVRFRAVVGRRPVPAVADLYSARAARLDLIAFSLGIPAMAAGVLFGSTGVVRLGSALFLAAVLLFVSQLVRIVWSNPQ